MTNKLASLTETRDRPLFSRSRRPPPPIFEAPQTQATSEVKAPAYEPPPFYLVGVVVGSNTRFVLLADHGGGKVSRLHLGEQQYGWRVVEIAVRSVVLEREGRIESVALVGPAPSPTVKRAPVVSYERIN